MLMRPVFPFVVVALHSRRPTPSNACASLRVIEGCSAKNRRISSSREWEVAGVPVLFAAGSFVSVAVKFALGRTILNALFVAMICG